jgi:hypothetical protein
VEVVDHQESAAQQVFAQLPALSVAEAPASHLDGVDPGPVEDLVALQVHHLLDRLGVKACQPAHALDELPVGFRVVGGPAPAESPEAASPSAAKRRIAQPGESPLGFLVGVGRGVQRAVVVIEERAPPAPRRLPGIEQPQQGNQDDRGDNRGELSHTTL